MSTIKFHDAEGKECKVFWPPENLDEVERNYHGCECECTLCREENTMEIERDDVVRFSTGREATGEELSRRAAGERLVAFAQRHVAKRGGTMAEALQVAYRLNPEWVRAYLDLQFPR